MIKITHYEVYTDTGGGWQLEDRFSSDQRQEAFNLAKEYEEEKRKVKIIKEIFDVQDNSYQESVEYVSNLSRKKPRSQGRGGSFAEDERDENGKIHITESVKSRNTVVGALIKLVSLIVISLVFANLFVSLLFPLLEIFIQEENSRSVLFGVFFVVFLAMSIPLLLKSVPWYVFMGGRNITKAVQEKKFYDKAEDLVRFYNLNDNIDPVMTPAYPEAPLEYKQYVISYLSELLSNIQSQTTLQNSFSRLGVKLLVYGGCLELARYSGLGISEANSILYDAFKIIDGNKTDLEAFYEAKRTYRDNKIAVFLTGVGAYLMAHVIEGRPMPVSLLNITFNKWEKQNSNPGEPQRPAEPEEPVSAEDVLHASMVSIKSDLKFMDTSVPNQEEVATNTSTEIRNIIFNLLNKYQGEDTIEANGITTIRFRKLNHAVKFALECLKDIATYQEETNNENLMLRNCCAVTSYEPENMPNLNDFLSDMFEHIYNNEIVATKSVAEALSGSEYKFDFLGEKNFPHFNRGEELYKLID